MKQQLTCATRSITLIQRVVLYTKVLVSSVGYLVASVGSDDLKPAATAFADLFARACDLNHRPLWNSWLMLSSKMANRRPNLLEWVGSNIRR